MSYVEMAELTVPGDQSLLKLDQTIEHYLQLHPMKTNDNNKTTSSAIASTLLVQCEAVNSAGRQEVPCGFLLRLLDGPPERPLACNFSAYDPGVTELNETLLQQLQNEEKSVFAAEDNINQEEEAVGIVIVDCLTGNAGAIRSGSNSGQQHFEATQQQRLHLLGIDSKFLSSNMTSKDSIELSLEKIKIKIDSWRWNRSAIVDTTTTAIGFTRFVLPRLVANESYHFLVYASNENGPSKLQWFGPIVFKWNDHGKIEQIY